MAETRRARRREELRIEAEATRLRGIVAMMAGSSGKACRVNWGDACLAFKLTQGREPENTYVLFRVPFSGIHDSSKDINCGALPVAWYKRRPFTGFTRSRVSDRMKIFKPLVASSTGCIRNGDATFKVDFHDIIMMILSLPVSQVLNCSLIGNGDCRPPLAGSTLNLNVSYRDSMSDTVAQRCVSRIQ